MRILALEFSSAQRSVAVVQPKAEGLPRVVAEVVETGGIGTKPLAMLDAALGEAKLEREQIEVLVVGLGPGSYTGIRTTIALAQGWQLAAGIKLLGISSAECIAAEAEAEGMIGRVAIVIDAQRDEYYLGIYELSPTGRRELEELRLASLTEIAALQKSGTQVVGPDVTTCFPGSRQLVPRAGRLGCLALGRDDFVPGERLEPIYLRQTTFVKAPPPKIFPQESR